MPVLQNKYRIPQGKQVNYKFEQFQRVRCTDNEHYGQTGTVSFCVPGNGSNPHVNIDLDDGGEALLPEWEVEAE